MPDFNAQFGDDTSQLQQQQKKLLDAYLASKGMTPNFSAPGGSQPAQAPQPQQPPLSTENLPPLPAVPQLKQQDIPKPLPPEFQSEMEIFKSPALILAGLGSLFSRTPITASLNAAASAMDGYRKGQQEVFERQREIWKEKTEEAVQQNKVELERYKAAWQNRDQAVKDRFAKMMGDAAGNDDQVMQAALKSGNVDLVEKIITARETAQIRLNNMVEGTKARAAIQRRLSEEVVTPETIDFMARQGLAGNQRMLMGWFRFPEIRTKIEAKMQQILQQEQGLSDQAAADQVTKNTARVNALNQGAGVLGRREALVTGAILTAQQTGPRVLQALQGVDRTKYSDLNKLIRAAETRTGSPDEIRLGIAVNTFINNYARASSSISGQTTDTARGEAMALLQPYWAKGQIEAGIDQMLNYELPSELKAAQEAVGEFTETFHGGRMAPPDQAAPAAPVRPAGPQPGTIEDGFRFKGGNPGDKANWEPVS